MKKEKTAKKTKEKERAFEQEQRTWSSPVYKPPTSLSLSPPRVLSLASKLLFYFLSPVSVLCIHGYKLVFGPNNALFLLSFHKFSFFNLFHIASEKESAREGKIGKAEVLWKGR